MTGKLVRVTVLGWPFGDSAHLWLSGRAVRRGGVLVGNVLGRPSIYLEQSGVTMAMYRSDWRGGVKPMETR